MKQTSFDGMSGRVLLINLGTTNFDDCLYFPTGLSLISSTLKRHGYSVDVIDMVIDNIEVQNIEKHLKRDYYDVIGCNGFVGNKNLVLIEQLVPILRKRYPRAGLVMGGALATSIPEILLSHFRLDALVLGEGEMAIVELLEAFGREANAETLSKIPGIAFRRGQEVRVNERAPRIADLDSLPFPDYEGFATERYVAEIEKRDRCFNVCAGRGCVGACKFCFRTMGGQITYRSPDNILAEWEYLAKKYGVRRLSFMDENFTNSKGFLQDFVEKILRSNLNIRFRGLSRVDGFDEELLGLLKRSGLFGLSVGLESGDDRILRNIGKGYDTRFAEQSLRLLEKHEILVNATFIVGFPEDDTTTIAHTGDFIRRNRSIRGRHFVGFLCPFPRTYYYELAKRLGFIEDELQFLTGIDDPYESLYVNLTENLSDEQLISYRSELMQIK